MAKLLTKALLAGTVLAAFPSTLKAQSGIIDALPQNPGLQGTIKNDGWYNLTREARTRTIDGNTYTLPANVGYPQFFMGNTHELWHSPIASQVHSDPSNRAALNKIANDDGSGVIAGYDANGVPKSLVAFNPDGTFNNSGFTWNGTGSGPYPAGDGLYSVPSGQDRSGSYGVFEASPLSGLQTIVFQIELGGIFWGQGDETMSLGSFTPSNFHPLLTLTFADQSSVTLTADWAAVLQQGYNGTIPVPSGPNGEDVEEDVYIDLYGFQWDLSGYDEIESFALTMTLSQHAQVYALRLDQSDVMTQVIPEPSSWALLIGSTALLGFALRRKTLC